MGILLGSKKDAQWVREKLEVGGDFSKFAEALSEHEESREAGGKLGWFTRGEAGPDFDEFIFDPEIELGVVSEPIFDDVIVGEGGYWLIRVSDKREKKEKADIQVILVSSREEAQTVRSRLDAGEDFGELAKELSQHDKSKEKEGKLTGVTPGKISLALDEFIFDSELQLETVSEPIRDESAVTKGGHWLIQVTGQDDNRRIEDDDRDLLKARDLEEWIEALWYDTENEVESYLDSDKELWAINQAKAK
jgi:parvulin-like peptidyl-prolyl isomerase